jgi:hypothetical protein
VHGWPLALGALLALEGSLATRAPVGEPGSATGPHVRLGGAFPTETARRAVRRAARLLEGTRCREVLAEFEDASGRPLESALDALGVSPAAYLENYVVFHDGAGQRACAARGTLAYTTPRSRVVHLCPRFLAKELQRPAFTQAVVIHEMLHTLGLGEDPPSSAEITDRVRRACAAR